MLVLKMTISPFQITKTYIAGAHKNVFTDLQSILKILKMKRGHKSHNNQCITTDIDIDIYCHDNQE